MREERNEMLPEYTQQTEQETSTIVIVGLGNDYRRDDAAGLLVARELKGQVPAQVSVHECTGASLELMDLWAGASHVVLVDAASSGAAPGTIYRFEVGSRPLPSFMFHYSTHDFNVADAIEFARMLGKLPKHLVVYGVEGADFDQGMGLSEDAVAAVETVTARVLKYVLGRVSETEN
jgi:hydrogenase maturation protease